MEINRIYNEDCLIGMKQLPDKSIDMVLCDLPYGVTKNDWDSVINLEKLWEQYNRVIKDNGAIVLFGQDKFSAKLMLSNEKYHRYNLIWDKELVTGFLNAERMPLRRHEDILVFYKNLPTYNPQKIYGRKNNSKGNYKGKEHTNNNYGNFKQLDNREKLGNMKYPASIVSFQKPHPSKSIHPTQKPTSLCNWLIKSFTNKGDLVLDSCMGSGTTAISCIETGRNFIGYEQDNNYFKEAQDRIKRKMMRPKRLWD